MAGDAAEEGRRALAAVETLLAERPHKMGHDFSEATRCVVAFRDALIEQSRHAVTPDLEQANAVLAAIIGGHFPLGDVPWKQIQAARDQLARMVSVD